jgi:aminoglycoside phosphotransferase (APT) family kinase protein
MTSWYSLDERRLRDVSDEEVSSYIGDKIEGYLNELHPTWSNIRVSGVRDITSGWETWLYRFELDYSSEGDVLEERLVLRVYSENASRKARREFTTMSRLHEDGYPVPKVYWMDDRGDLLGRPFIVMDFIEGRSMEEEFLSGSEEDLKRALGIMMDLFVELHSIDAARLFPEHVGVTTLGYIESMLDWAKKNEEDSGVELTAPIIDWLEEHKAGVTPMEPSLLHRDFHPMNIMIRADGSPVVLDWGATTVGDRRDDVAWIMVLASTFLEPSLRDIILRGYESASRIRLVDIEFFEVLSILRRLTDVSVSLKGGAERHGLRDGAEEMMREASGHLHKILSYLDRLTGIRLPQFEEFLEKL